MRCGAGWTEYLRRSTPEYSVSAQSSINSLLEVELLTTTFSGH